MDDIAAFVAVAQNASFTRAAERLGSSKSNVGKAVQRLEARLGTRLLQRTTRAVSLTEEGATYLLAAQAALDGLNEAEVMLAVRRREPAGRVRLDIPVGFGTLLLPTFAAFLKQYPKVTLDLTLSDRISDAVAEGWDIVVRIGDLPPAGDMTVRKLCELRLGLFASDHYLATHAQIASIKALRDHQAVVFRAASGQLRPWMLSDGGRIFEMMPRTTLIVTDGRAMLDSVAGGLGIGQIFDKVARPYVDAGQMRPVLPEADVAGPPVHALIPVGRRMPAKTRALLEHLARVLGSRTKARAARKQ